MSDCKLQMGCLIILFYIMVIDYTQRKKYMKKWKFSLFDCLL